MPVMRKVSRVAGLACAVRGGDDVRGMDKYEAAGFGARGRERYEAAGFGMSEEKIQKARKAALRPDFEDDSGDMVREGTLPADDEQPEGPEMLMDRHGEVHSEQSLERRTVSFLDEPEIFPVNSTFNIPYLSEFSEKLRQREARQELFGKLSEEDKKKLIAEKIAVEVALNIAPGETAAERDAKTRRLIKSSVQTLMKLESEYAAMLREKYGEKGEEKMEEYLKECKEAAAQPDSDEAETPEKEGSEGSEDKADKPDNKELTGLSKQLQKLIDNNKILTAHPRPVIATEFGFCPEFLLKVCFIMFFIMCFVAVAHGVVSPAPSAALMKPEQQRTAQDRKNIAKYTSPAQRNGRLFISLLFWTVVCVCYIQSSFVTYLAEKLDYEAFQYKLALNLYEVKVFDPTQNAGVVGKPLYDLGTPLVTENEVDVWGKLLKRKDRDVLKREGQNVFVFEKLHENFHKSSSSNGLTEEEIKKKVEKSAETSAQWPLLLDNVVRDHMFIPQEPAGNWYRQPVIFSAFMMFVVVWTAYTQNKQMRA